MLDTAKALLVLAGNYSTSSLSLAEASSLIYDLGPTVLPQEPPYVAPKSDPTAILVNVARNSREVRDYLMNGEKIKAIKAHRALTGCGLKESKDAVEATGLYIRRTY